MKKRPKDWLKFKRMANAAPDLLAASQWALDMIDGGYIHPPLELEPRTRFYVGVTLLKAAIRKAQGGKA